jgi:hypothetical protein
MNTQNKYMYKYLNFFLALLLVSVTLIGGCETADTATPEVLMGKGVQPVQVLDTEADVETVLRDNVYPLKEATVEAIIGYEDGEIIIPVDAPYVNEIEKDQIIVYGISDKTPVGLLRRVVSIEPDTAYISKTADATGNVIRPKAIDVLKIITTFARLQDIFKNGRILVSDKQLFYGDLESKTKAEVGWDDKTESIVVSVNETLTGSNGGEVSLNGDIFIKPKFDFDIRFYNYELQYIEFRDKTTITSDVKLTVKQSFRTEADASIYTLTFKPMTKWVKGIPIVYRPVIDIRVGAKGDITAKIDFSVEHEVSYKRAYKYSQEQGWSREEPEPARSLIEFSEPEPTIAFWARAYVRPKLKIIFYELAGLYATAEFYLQLDANPSETIWWELRAGVDVYLGFEFEILGDELPNYEKAVIRKDWPLDSADGPVVEPEPPPPEPEPPPAPEPDPPPAPEPEPPEPEPAPPAGTGNENIRIVYNNNFAYVMGITQGSVWVRGLEFKRVDNQGVETASFHSQTWASYYSGYDPIKPGYCPRIALPNSPNPTDCTVSVNRETQQEQYHFWKETATSKQFQVLQNGILLQTCEISAGSCDVYVPQP